MSKYSEWRQLQKPSWKEVFRRNLKKRLSSALPAILIAVAFLVLPDAPPGLKICGLAMLLASLTGLFVASLLNRRGLRLKDYLPHHAEKFRGTPHHAVKVTIYKDDKPIGQDLGIVTFDLNMLRYEGLQSAFALGRGDVFLQEGASLAKQAGPLRIADDPSMHLKFESISSEGSDPIAPKLAAWLQSDEIAVGERLLPPNVPLNVAPSVLLEEAEKLRGKG